MEERRKMDWGRLITNKRLGQENRHMRHHDERSEFKRDYDRLIFSAPFRRMQNKTQVFPLPGSVFVHNRLTHSLEVASVGLSLGNDVARELKKVHPELRGTLFEDIGTIVSTACLAHDMGNPPFGHSGEKAIQTYFTEGPGRGIEQMVNADFWSDITHFEGNANAFRLLAHRFNGRREGGFVMTYSTLGSIVKYPFVSAASGKKKKFGFFTEELPIYEKIADEMGIFCLSENDAPKRYARHPLVYLVEAADDICYEIMDLEDSHKLRILSYQEVEDLLLAFFDDESKEKIRKRIKEEGIDDDNEKVVYMRARTIGMLENECVKAFVNNEDSILSGTFNGSLINNLPDPAVSAYNRCKTVSVEKIYNSQPVLDVELGGYHIMETLMETFISAAMNPEKFHSQQLLQRVSNQYDIHADDLETRIMAVIDYISGMTDVYALDIYQKINGTALPII